MPGRETLATVHIAQDWNSVEMMIGPFTDLGWRAQAKQILSTLQSFFSKTLTDRHPDIPVPDMLAHWTPSER